MLSFWYLKDTNFIYGKGLFDFSESFSLSTISKERPKENELSPNSLKTECFSEWFGQNLSKGFGSGRFNHS